MVVVNHDDSNGESNGTIRASLRFRWGVVLGLGGQTVALVAWLVQMHADVAQLKVQQEINVRSIIRLDEGGSRPMVLVQQRQNDIIATNGSQDTRIRDLELKIIDMTRLQIENKFWIDQMAVILRPAPFRGGDQK